MQVQLCRKSLERLGSGSTSLLSALRDREHAPVVKDCLNRCERCEQGEVIAVADGIPFGAPAIDVFLQGIDALAADDEG